MRNMRQILSVVLVLLLTLSCCVFAVSAEEFTPSQEPIIYFEVPDNWENYASIFCHIWPYGGDPLANWQSKKEKCTATDTEGVYSYDISKVGTLVEGEYYCVIFSADTGKQTYDCLMGVECFGDTLYCDGTIFENPQDSSKTAQAAVWRHQDPLKYGPMMQISSIGNLVGTALPPGQTAEDIFVDFLTNNLDNTRTYSGKTDQAIVDDIAASLKFSDETVAQLIADTGVYVDWVAGRVATPDETTPDETTPDETTGDESGPNDDVLESTTDFILGDANMDGNVNVKDATYVQKAVADLVTMTQIEKIAADANGDNRINVKDATAIQKHVAGMEVFPPINLNCKYDPDTSLIHIEPPVAV